MNSLKVTTISGRGRAYCANKPIAKGSTVLTSSPIAAIISQEWLPETCLWCFHCSYPRRNKIRAIEHLNSKQRKTPFESSGFCSEECKEGAIKSNHEGEWQSRVEAFLALDHEYMAREQHEGIATPATSDVDSKDYFGGSLSEGRTDVDEFIDIDDEIRLQQWIDGLWNLAVSDTGFLANVKTYLPDTGRIDMCKLIATCLIRKHYCDKVDNSDESIPKYDSLMLMQYNEVTRFQDLYKKSDKNGLSDIDRIPTSVLQSFQDAAQYVPEEIMQDIQLYLFFSTSFEKSKTSIPWQFDHQLFRQLLYREMSNSFGIWDPPEGCEQELLGWALHPHAVFFNHSCAPNIRKVRHGRDMVFIAEEDIQEGDELCIAYGSVAEPVDERRTRLLENYSFWCECTRCNKESS